ncbi:MAG: isochorismatase family protein, partial [Planococcus donghaensis]
TSLSSILTYEKVDTVIITGCTTSGCVRATAVDALQHGYRVVVPEECVGDRSVKAHKANLYDIQTKYGDVVEMETVKNYLKNLKGDKSYV